MQTCQVRLSEFLGALDEELSRTRTVHLVDTFQEQAILVSVSRQSHGDQEESLAELAELARSAGLMVLDTIVQRPQALHPKYLLGDRKSTRLNSSHVRISYAVFCLKKKKKNQVHHPP